MRTTLTILALWITVDLSLLVYSFASSPEDRHAIRLGNWGGWMLLGKLLFIMLGLVLVKIWS